MGMAMVTVTAMGTGMSNSRPDGTKRAMSTMRRRPLSMKTLRIGVAGVPVIGLLAMATAGAYAQEAGSGGASSGRAVTLVPRVTVSETLTDNVRLSNANRQSEQVTEISPGIHIGMNGARVKGFFDYALTGVYYGQNSAPSRTQHALNTFGSLEAVENWAFIDFSGSISQQAVSALGTQFIDNTAINPNRTEVSSYRISPYVRGRLGDMANYEARYSRAVTSSDTVAASGVTAVDGSVTVSGASAFRNLGWSTNASRQNIGYNAGRTTEADQLNLNLSYAITPQLSVSVGGGREANNYTSFDKQNYSTNSVGVSWSPSAMTRVLASRGHRSFGDTHSVSVEHRTARTVWRFSDSKDVAVTPNQQALGSLGSIYNLLYNQFASVEPNEVARAQLVSAYLQTYGISPNAVVVGSFLTSALSLQRRQDLSFALLGVRDTVTFIATRGESTRLDTMSTGIDDFTSSAVVRQRGFSVNYAHRLTPEYSLAVLVSQQNTSSALAVQDSTLRLINISLTGRVGRRVMVAVGVRHVVSSGASPYAENAITGNLTVQF